jgi:hypothetical protein
VALTNLEWEYLSLLDRTEQRDKRIRATIVGMGKHDAYCEDFMVSSLGEDGPSLSGEFMPDCITDSSRQGVSGRFHSLKGEFYYFADVIIRMDEPIDYALYLKMLGMVEGSTPLPKPHATCFDCAHAIVYEDEEVGISKNLEDCGKGFGEYRGDISSMLEMEECAEELPKLCKCFKRASKYIISLDMGSDKL